MNSTETVRNLAGPPRRESGFGSPATERRAPTLDAALTRAVRTAIIQETERLRAVVRDEFARALPPQTNDPNEILTVEEAAIEAKCSPRTIAAACKSKNIDGHKPPGLNEWRISRAALFRWAHSDGTPDASTTSAIDIDAKARNAAGRLLDLPAGANRRNK